MTYRMKHYQKTADGYQAVGDLTLRGVTTKNITLTGTSTALPEDPGGNAEGWIQRRG